jgi:conjugal transfer/entry exclusion protein
MNTVETIILGILVTGFGWVVAMFIISYNKMVTDYEEQIQSYKNLEKNADKLIDTLEQQIDQLKNMLEPIIDLSNLSPEQQKYMREYLSSRYNKKEQ